MSNTTTNTTTITAPATAALARLNPADVAEIPGIHHVVVVPPTAAAVHVGGQVAMDEHGGMPSDFSEQTRLAARNLRRCLAAAGAGVADLVRVRAFIVGLTPERLEQFEAAVFPELPEWNGPTATLIGVDALFVPGALIEIDAEAAIVRD